jgi:hypothetical protein
MSGRYVIPFSGYESPSVSNPFLPLPEILNDLRVLIEAAGGEFNEPVLTIEIKRACKLITDYCHVQVPNDVYIAYVPKMVFDLLRLYFRQGKGVQSISEQGTSITYADIPAVGDELELIFEPLKPQLNKHRKAIIK